MADPVEFTCRECGAESRIGNMDWLTSITGKEPEELFYCDAHLNDALEGVVLDLSIGGDHTRSREFEAQREQRRAQRNEGNVARAKEIHPITFVAVFHDDEWDEDKIEIEMPGEAKTDLKQLKFQLTHRKYDQQRQSWTIDASALDRAVEHMEQHGWTVEVAPTVRARVDGV